MNLFKIIFLLGWAPSVWALENLQPRLTTEFDVEPGSHSAWCVPIRVEASELRGTEAIVMAQFNRMQMKLFRGDTCTMPLESEVIMREGEPVHLSVRLMMPGPAVLKFRALGVRVSQNSPLVSVEGVFTRLRFQVEDPGIVRVP